jgi:hypothetical protein
MSANTDFVLEPHQYANMHCLYPFTEQAFLADGSKVVYEETQQVLNPIRQQMETKTIWDLQQVKGQDRVAYCNILPSSAVSPCQGDMIPRSRPVPPNDTTQSYTTHSGLMVMHITKASSAPDAIPTYYLPWKPDRLYRMTLKPSKNDPHGPRDPDLFVTAALQGCSVFVIGSETDPVVYHANAASVKGPQGESFNQLNADSDIAMGAKVQTMAQRFGYATTNYPKDPHVPLNSNAQPVTVIQKSATIQDYMHASAFYRQVPALKQFYVRRYQPSVRSSDNEPKLQVQQFGTVFGVRRAGLWKFYRQTRTYVQYLRPGETEWRHEWTDPVCIRFWP